MRDGWCWVFGTRAIPSLRFLTSGLVYDGMDNGILDSWTDMYTATTQRIDNKDTLSLRPLTDEKCFAEKRIFCYRLSTRSTVRSSSSQHDLALKQSLGGPIHRDALDPRSERAHSDVGEDLAAPLPDAHLAPRDRGHLLADPRHVRLARRVPPFVREAAVTGQIRRHGTRDARGGTETDCARKLQAGVHFAHAESRHVDVGLALNAIGSGTACVGVDAGRCEDGDLWRGTRVACGFAVRREAHFDGALAADRLDQS